MADAAEFIDESDSAGGSGGVVLRDRFTIMPTMPLPDLDSPKAKAFAATDRKDPNGLYFALVCTSDLVLRTDAMSQARGLESRALLRQMDWGTVEWPPLRRRCVVMVLERPLAGRIFQVMAGGRQRGIDDQKLVRLVIEPLANAIKEMGDRGIPHRGVRADNLFYTDDDQQRVALGEAFSAPPGYYQPVVFETIPSGMCHPAGRGLGTIEDDLYALGVTFLFLLVGRNPVAHLSDAEILAAKIERTSYVALCADERISLNMMEPLRGLLCDNPEERWNFEKLDLWINGRRLSPLQVKPDRKAPRPFNFAGQNLYTCRSLGAALVRHWDMAFRPIRDGLVEMWLRRGLEDKDRSDLVAYAVRNADITADDKRAVEDIMVARVAMILDPRAPIRYKNLAAMPDGLGSLLAAAARAGTDVQLVPEALLRDIPKYWLELRGSRSTLDFGLDKAFQTLKTYLNQTGPGYGLERCLYELNPTLHCLSTLVESDFVVDIADLLPALNRAAKGADTNAWPFDRHLAAFVAARFDEDLESQVAALNSPDPENRALAMLSFLAMIQWRLGPESLFALASWVGGLVTPAVNTFHSRSRRRELEEEIPRVVRRGSLPELFNLLDNADDRKRDSDGFAGAIQEYSVAEAEIVEIESAGAARVETANLIGQQAAAFVATMVALVTVSILFLLQAL